MYWKTWKSVSASLDDLGASVWAPVIPRVRWHPFRLLPQHRAVWVAASGGPPTTTFSVLPFLVFCSLKPCFLLGRSREKWCSPLSNTLHLVPPVPPSLLPPFCLWIGTDAQGWAHTHTHTHLSLFSDLLILGYSTPGVGLWKCRHFTINLSIWCLL